MSSEPRKRRQYGPKTRTGCQTCKIRRVKCDEEKPACKRCTSTGRKCDGYAQDLSIPSPNDKDYGAIVQRIVTHMPGNSQEKRGFQYFVTTTSEELSGFFTSSFWENVILQASASEPALRHGVVAIGSLHEEFAHNRLSYDSETTGKGQAFAVSQYTKAIGHLRRSLLDGKQAPMTALMSCILFACFDSLRGYFHNAMMHIQSGLKILRDFKTKSPEDAYMVDTNIKPLFMRLSIQAILYIDTRSTIDRRDIVHELAELCSKENEVPDVFTSLEDARKHMNQSAHGLFRMFYMCETEKPMHSQPPAARRMFVQYDRQIRAWNKAFEKFMAIHSHTFNSKQLRGSALLKIHHIVATMMADNTPDELDDRSLAEAVNDRKKYAKYGSEFRIVVNLARSLITAAEQDQKAGKPPLTFSTDLGLVGPLYYVSIRSQEQEVKMQALELLLRVPRREGMWDSESAARMAREYWEIERRHDEAQKLVSEGGNEATSVPLCDIVDLVFGDGMRWEWKWKYPLGIVPVKLKTPDGSDVVSTYTDDWKDLLEDQSWFMEDFSMGNLGTPLTENTVEIANTFETELPGTGNEPLLDITNSLGADVMFELDCGIGFESESSNSPGTADLLQWVVPQHFVSNTPSDSETTGL